MADNGIPAISGSKSFDVMTPSDTKNERDGETKNRTYSLDDSLGVSNYEEDGLDPEDEDEEDEEIRLAKEMALAIAENPNMTPDQLREIQEESKKRAAAATASKVKKKKGVKAFRSSFKAGVKAVSNVATGRKSPLRTRSASSNSASPSFNFSSKMNAIPAFSDHKIPATGASPGNVGRSITVEPRVGEFPEGRARRGSADDVGSVGGSAVGGRLRTSSDSSIRLTGILWKRRSGLGKYSSHAAWERRRVVLEGTKLLYYKTSNLDNDDASVDDSNHEQESPAADAVNAGGSNWLGMRSINSSVKPVARGDFDLLKDQATVAASYGHTGAPTPFALSIKVLGQTKWKLCFDTHEELMEWLAAMTDIVVQGSVDSYNALILEAHDPRNHAGGGTPQMYGQLSEPPRNLSPQYADKQEAIGGHRLWSTGHYNVKSAGFPEAAMEEMHDIFEDVDSDADEDVQVAEAGDSLMRKAGEVAQESSKERVGGSVISLASNQSTIRRASPVFGLTKAPSDEAMIAAKKPTATALAIPEPNDDYKPVAGTTTIRIENPTDLPVKDGIIFGGWRTADPNTMMVRSVGYKNNKKKCSSPGELYGCINVDIFESRTRYPDMASRVTLPQVDFPDKEPKTWNAPDLFVITIAIPTDPPKLYGSAENGGGYTITMYYKMHQETRDILRRVTAEGYKPSDESEKSDPNASKVNAVRLLEEWCRRAPTDDNFMARFKVVPNAQNLKEIGIPSWISKYNGKPFLIKRPGQTGFLYRHPEKSCIEFDISLHPFPYLAKQGICYMKDAFFKKVLVTFGFLIEGRSDNELPECLIGLFQLCYPDPQHAIQGEDFFAGTSPRSF
ncbi:DUF1336 domain containing protein [Nitzschia inconspicua]|uniref:DUF1336 domain containing protein n=1 Tax=Nitzschia inconspicua TaxID=303405 RepID=A0A9K3L4W9_9STRA|nr:DUF1336 domain containing protein [Nitzschia inconspicua]